jgi:hypothetical protein
MAVWMFAHGIMPLYTPLGGTWLNMAESIQRIIERRALSCQYPQVPEEIIKLLEATVRGWNLEPTPFEWGGARAVRRARSRQRRHALGGSGACAAQPMRVRKTICSTMATFMSIDPLGHDLLHSLKVIGPHFFICHPTVILGRLHLPMLQQILYYHHIRSSR